MKVSPGFISAEEHGLVGLRAGIGLHVGETAAEQAAGALDGERFGDVDELASAIVAPAGIALGVLVGHHRALRLEHGAGDDVLGGDQLDLVALAAEFLGDGVGDLGIAVGQGGGKEAVGHVALATRFADGHAVCLQTRRAKRASEKQSRCV